jgi:uncharacterized tellurite resistance protein B-like protein
MIDIMKRFFGKGTEHGAGSGEENSAHDVRVAACALFLEMANIDGEFSDLEMAQVLTILEKDYGLSPAHAESLVEIASDELKGSIDLWQFTNRINQHYTLEEKLEIITLVWRIAYADGKLDKHEDYLVHKLANLLRLQHKQLIDAKVKVLHGG